MSHAHGHFVCRSCYSALCDHGEGFATPMLCDVCFGATWVYLVPQESLEFHTREVQAAMLLYARLAIATAKKRLKQDG